jgi:hypothetical protein
VLFCTPSSVRPADDVQELIRVPLAARIGALGMTVMIIGMWATRPASECVMPAEPRRHINLARIVDREHLAADVLESERIARRYSAALAAAPADSQSLLTRPETLADQCQAALVGQIAAAHNVTADQVRSATVGNQ